MIADDQNRVVAGGSPNAYNVSLDEVERFSLDPKRPRFRKDNNGQMRWHIPETDETVPPSAGKN
jgi:hypothetical protein